jgi:hypothetical protein
MVVLRKSKVNEGNLFYKKPGFLGKKNFCKKDECSIQLGYANVPEGL